MSLKKGKNAINVTYAMAAMQAAQGQCWGAQRGLGDPEQAAQVWVWAWAWVKVLLKYHLEQYAKEQGAAQARGHKRAALLANRQPHDSQQQVVRQHAPDAWHQSEA